VLAAVIAAPALALAVYLALGSPGMADHPFAARMKGWMAANPIELQPQELAAVLKKLIAERAPDPEGYRLLAIAESASQNAPETIRALRHALKLAPERADLWEMLGQAELAEADGKLTDDAKAAFRQAVARDPKAVVARFYLAQAQIEAGDKPAGLSAWKALMTDLPADDPRRPAIAQQIALHEGRAEPAPAPNGGQMDMIRGMVEGLAQRLKANPDDPEGWVKLVRAYAVLNEPGKRDAALATARARYAGKPEVLQALTAASHAEPMK